MTRLTVVDGGGEGGDGPVCGICGLAAMAPGGHPCLILREHLEWLRLRGKTPGTIYSRKRALARMAALLPVPLTEATEGDLLAWRAALDLTDGTVVHYVSHAKEFYKWMTGRGLREDNPAAGLPVPPMGRRLPRPIGEDDLMFAVATAPPRIRPWLVLAGWAGLRSREIARLRRENVLDSLRPPVLLVAFDATKGHGERVIPASEFVLAELRAAGLPRSGWVFGRYDGQAGPNQAWLVSQLCGEHLRACGIQASLHQLRHRFGTALYRATHDLRLVQAMLGHASPSTTAGYAAYDNSDAAAAIAALPAPGGTHGAVRAPGAATGPRGTSD